MKKCLTKRNWPVWMLAPLFEKLRRHPDVGILCSWMDATSVRVPNSNFDISYPILGISLERHPRTDHCCHHIPSKFDLHYNSIIHGAAFAAYRSDTWHARTDLKLTFWIIFGVIIYVKPTDHDATSSSWWVPTNYRYARMLFYKHTKYNT